MSERNDSAADRTRRKFLGLAVAAGGATLLGCATTGSSIPAPHSQPAVVPASKESAPAAAKHRKLSILILGGTSFLGPAIVEEAQRRGHSLTLFNRGRTNPQLFPDIEKLHGNRDGDLKALEGRSWDAVIDTSGYVPRVVTASVKLLAPRIQQYLFISTLSVYADTSKPGLDETAPLAQLADPSNEDVRANYGALKALCEAAAEKEMPGRVTVVRPGLICGPGDPTDRYTYWPVRIARGGEVLAPGDGSDPIQYIDVRDLASFCLTAVENGAHGLFNANGPATRLTMRELLTRIQSGVGGNANLTWVSGSFLDEQKVGAWSDLPVWIPAQGEMLGFHQMRSDRAIQDGLTFRPAEETAKATLDWFRSEPPERQAKLRAGLSAERETQLLAAWHKRGA